MSRKHHYVSLPMKG